MRNICSSIKSGIENKSPFLTKAQFPSFQIMLNFEYFLLNVLKGFFVYKSLLTAHKMH